MKKLILEDSEILKIAFQQEIARSPESRYDHRLHGMLLLCKGLSTYEVGDLLGHSPRTIQSWFHRFQEEGLRGLLDAEGQGRPSSLNRAQQDQIAQDLRKSPTMFGYSQGQWDGVLLAHHLQKELGAPLGVRQCQRLFHQLGFRHRKPRGVIAGADPDAQVAYKKTSPVRRKG